MLFGLSALAAILPLRPLRRSAGWLMWSGSAAAGLAVGLRWGCAHQMPLAGLYEVMLCLAALIAPLAWMTARLAGPAPRWLDPLLGCGLLAGVFVMDPTPRQMPAVLRSSLLIPHVGAYLLAYVLVLKAAVAGAMAAVLPADSGRHHEAVGYRTAAMAFPLLTGGLVLGALWGQRAWGDWWNWDPKELWSLATWLSLVGYFHVRGLGPAARRRIGPALLAGVGVLVVLTLLWANLSTRFSGLHSYAE